MSLIPYGSRVEAGEILADLVKNKYLKGGEYNLPSSIAFCIPNGGVPIAEGFCDSLDLKYMLLIVRKIKIPSNPEAGFGSITTDGTVLLNNALLSRLDLPNTEIEKSIDMTKREIESRLNYYNLPKAPEDSYKKAIQDKILFIMDDGLASGYTMLAGIKMLRKYHPKKIIITVPTAPYHTVEFIKQEVDEVICPNVRKTSWFAVADAYKHWYDVPDSEVLNTIKQSKNYLKIN